MTTSNIPEIYTQLHTELCDLSRLLVIGKSFKIYTDEISIKIDSSGRCNIKTLGYKITQPFPEGDYDPYTIPFWMMPNVLFIHTHAIALWSKSNESVLKIINWDMLFILHNRIRQMVLGALVYGRIHTRKRKPK